MDQEQPGQSFVDLHLERIKERLVAQGQEARSFGSNLNKGSAREAFVRDFLEQSTSDFWGIGSGEIISRNDDGERNQLDVIVHNRRYPTLSSTAGVDLFFPESVSAFVEVKTQLQKRHLETFAETSRRIKASVRISPQQINTTALIKNPRPYAFLFAYGGPRRIKTVQRWLAEIASTSDYRLDELRQCPPEKRSFFDHHFIDGVFVLGTGYVAVDALPTRSHLVNSQHSHETDLIWEYSDRDELRMLWLLINLLNQMLFWTELDHLSYLGPWQGFMADE